MREGRGRDWDYIPIATLSPPLRMTKMGSDESHFNVSVGSDGQSHKTVSTNHNLFEEKGEPKRYRTEVLPPALSFTARPTGSQIPSLIVFCFSIYFLFPFWWFTASRCFPVAAVSARLSAATPVISPGRWRHQICQGWCMVCPGSVPQWLSHAVHSFKINAGVLFF